MRIALAKLMLLAAVVVSVCADLSEDEEGDEVTWAKCKKDIGWPQRVLGPLPDYNATKLALFDCNLTEIRTGDIYGLPNVYVIFLAGNKIEHLDPVIFDSFRKLNMLRLDSNKLREVPAFGEHAMFPNVTWLDLSRNLITRIDNPKTFSSKLQSINLDYNPIGHLHPDVFKGLPDLNYLQLSCTKIKSIPSTMFQLSLVKPISIYLSFNLIEYVAPHAFSGTKLKALSLEANRITRLPADFASEFVTPDANAKPSIYFYGNPWNCACLLEFLAELKRLVYRYGAFETALYKTKPACVFVGAKCDRNTNLSLSSSLLSLFPSQDSWRAGGICGRAKKQWE